MWTIYAVNLKRKLLNPIVLVNYTLLPLLLILILGNALSGVFESSSKSAAAVSFSQVTTVVVNEDSSEMGEQIVQFLTSPENEALYKVTIEESADHAKALLESGEVDQFIHIPANLGSDVGSNKDSNVVIYGKDSNVEKVNITSLTLSAFGDGYLSMDIASSENQKVMYTHVYENLLHSPNQATEGGAESATTEEKSDVSAISYYGVTMLVLILVYGLANTMNFVQEEYSEALGDRYLVTPISRTGLVVAQFLTGCTITIVQGIIIVISAKVFFQASYGESLWFVLFIILAGAIFFNALGLFLGVIGRKFKQLDSIVTLLIPAMTFIGGGFIKIDMGGLSNFSINELFQRPLFDYMNQGAINLVPVFNALGYSLAFVAIAVFVLSRKGVR
ncbi:ABC transporter permease [Paenibacillus sp. GSMTC-2017]|uniref:ABC transporter permease n=1 Tax=Paenibacillus sp. GSMTC-2017 TaxID=2794350 RepID=UPI0018D68E9A|nr:ABC transporter permease [Paenibacillus sp. GSMTC-2017]MBH5320075.1 ABC transporter permease [Paenibacillus sp. GSMTC-2017]